METCGGEVVWFLRVEEIEIPGVGACPGAGWDVRGWEMWC